MAEGGLPVHLSARNFNFRADTEADFVAGCYSGLQMLLTAEEQAQELWAAGLPAETSHRAETGGEGPRVEGAVNAPQWRVEDEVGEDEPAKEPEGATGNALQLDVAADDELVVTLPLDEHSLEWHSPSPSPPEAPYQGRPQRAVPPLSLPRIQEPAWADVRVIAS